MSEQLSPTRAVAAVKFKWQKAEDGKTYDYFVPAGLELQLGDKVMVETRRGETEVTVVEIKTESGMAEKEVLRLAPVAEEAAPAAKSEEWNF